MGWVFKKINKKCSKRHGGKGRKRGMCKGRGGVKDRSGKGREREAERRAREKTED